MANALEEKLVALKHDLNKSTDLKGSDFKKCWLRIGLYEISKSNWDEAIHCFQNCLRIDTTDYNLWQCLGDAYMSRGSYSTALKAFTKCLALIENDEQKNEDKFYCNVKIAQIRKTMHEYFPAIEKYEEILIQDPECLLALIGIAETSCCIGETSFKEGLYSKGLFFTSKSLNYAIKASKLNTNICLPWNIAANSCLLICLNVHQNRAVVRYGDRDMTVKDTLLLGIYFCQKCLYMKISSDSLWYNLSIFYLILYRQENCETWFKKSIFSAMKAVSLGSLNTVSKYWNILGIISEEPKLIRHCFIEALHQSTVTTEQQWNNLGVLYFKLMQGRPLEKGRFMQLCHQSFATAQAQDPTFVNCWVGQALIAEQMKHKLTLDLFRHCNSLSHNLEACVAFPFYTLESNSSHLNFTAIDCLQKSVSGRIYNFTSLTLLALLMEKIGNKKLSFAYFEKAILQANVKNQQEIADSKLNCFRAALFFSNDIINPDEYSFEGSNSNVQFLIYYAFTLWKNSEYSEAITQLEKALKFETNNLIKHDILIAIGSILRVVNKSGKAMFLEAVKLNFDQEMSLLYIILDALQDDDRDILNTSLQGLLKRLRSHKLDHFLPLCLILMHSTESFEKNLSITLLRLYPDIPELWLARAIQLTFFQDATKISHIVHFCKICRNLCNYQSTKKSSSIIFLTFVVTAFACNLQTGIDQHQKNAMRYYQKALHISPENLDLQTLFKNCSNKQEINLKQFKIRILSFIIQRLF